MNVRLQPGEIINGTYTVEDNIGAGAFAEVYLVNHRFLGKQAMKVLLPAESNNGHGLNEARHLVDLNHRRIVRVYDANVFERGGTELSFMTMEYAEKGTLNSLISTQVRLHPSLSLRLCSEIAEALAHAHSLDPPLVHLDIKPSNVLIVESEGEIHVKVSDFGLAQTLDSESRLCKSAGTLAFAPPEMAWGVADERTDVYGIGVTLYRTLTGIHPFPIFSPESVTASREYHQALSAGRRSIKPPSQMLLQNHHALDPVIMKALAFDMFSRHRNAIELLDELNRVS